MKFNDNFGEMTMLTETITKHEFSSPGADWSNGNKRGAAPHSLTDRQEASDEALIKSLAEGDKHAFQVLFARYNMRAFRFALRFVRDESLAEDLVSDVFLEAWRQAGIFEGRSQVSTWLLAIARNKAIDVLRRCSDVQLNEEMATTIEDSMAPSIGRGSPALLARRPTKVAAIALANKLARMAWAMMARGERYREPAALAA
jgi:RNA polymerase sigma factor (sigma-70 family)